MLEQVVGWICIMLILICGTTISVVHRQKRLNQVLLGVSLVCLGLIFVGVAVMMNV